MKYFRGLQVWNKAHALTLNCYRATRPSRSPRPTA